MALDRREAKIPDECRKDRHHLQHREAHADADARAGAEGQVSAAMVRLGFIRRKAVRVESVRASLIFCDDATPAPPPKDPALTATPAA